MTKKPFLVDIPVRVNIWIRPDAQRKQFDVLKQARPSILFLISDGGRNETEWEAIRQNRSLFDNEIDWDCTVYKLYEEKNNGLYAMSRKGAQLIWSVVDRCIMLEDDNIVSVSYFQYAADLLERYKDDTRIVSICAMNYAGIWERTSSDYFFAERGPIWGQATWKRSYENRDFSLEYGKDPYILDLLKKNLRHNKGFLKTVNGYAHNSLYGRHIPGGEFLNRLSVHTQHQLYIIPKYNMMCNIGCTANGTHTAEYNLLPRGIRRLYNMSTYEYRFPLNHPKYIIPDSDYAEHEEKVLCRNRPIRAFLRRFEVMFLCLRYRGINEVAKNIICKIRKKNYET